MGASVDNLKWRLQDFKRLLHALALLLGLLRLLHRLLHRLLQQLARVCGAGRGRSARSCAHPVSSSSPCGCSNPNSRMEIDLSSGGIGSPGGRCERGAVYACLLVLVHWPAAAAAP